MLAKMWRKGNTFALLVGMQVGVASVESSIEIPQKIKSGSSFWPRYPTCRKISEGTQNTNLKEHKHSYVHSALFTNSQDMGAAQVYTSRWVDKTTMGHLHNGIIVGHKKEENFTLCNSMNEPGEYYAK